MNMQNLHEDQRAVIARLEKEYKASPRAGYHTQLNGPIYNCLVGFRAQDIEFARLMLSSDKTLKACFEKVSGDVKNGCSDFEVYTKAVQYYLPGVKVRMWMEIDMIGESEGVAFGREGDLTVDVYGKKNLPQVAEHPANDKPKTTAKPAKTEKNPANAEKKAAEAATAKSAKVLDMPKQQTSDDTEDAAPKKRKMISFDFLGL
jgi:hypothetical protein